MLVNLQIRNFAIVDRIDIEFGAGMTVLTGETGAGKSILVDALGLVLGERGSATYVRSGAKRAEFSAEFDVTGLPEALSWLETGALDEDDGCFLRRVINTDGRSRAFINGNAVPVQQLKELGEILIDIHGQHFHQSLGRRRVQRDLLDHFGCLGELRDDTATAFVKWQSLEERLQHLRAADADRTSRLELVRFQLQELTTLDAVDGEYETLSTERQKLANSGRLVEGISAAIACLSDDDAANAVALLAESRRSIEALVAVDAELAAVAELLDGASIQLDEACDSLQRYADSVDVDPRHREQVEERLDSMRTIARKHRVDASQLPALAAQLARELDDLDHAEERGRELESDVAAARKAFFDRASSLSGRRQAAAAKFGASVSETMAGLGMPGGVFEVDITQVPEGSERADGIDDVRFLISANPGQPPMPLSSVASGGELSRMSLAIQVVASDGSPIPTMIFDEIDSGVGGRVAEIVGRRLAELGDRRQVLCVTHLAQVASLADHHVRISKVTDGKATRTNVKLLEREERIDELARMLGGIEITQKTREHAAELLAGAPRKRA